MIPHVCFYAVPLLLLLGLQAGLASAQLGVSVRGAVDLADSPSPQDAEAKELEGLLHWAIENSDHDELSRKAEEAEGMGIDELKATLEERKQRVKELSDIMSSQVTETQMIQELITILNNVSTPMDNRLYALTELQDLVGPIDNANDLRPLNGIKPIVDHLTLDCCKSLISGAEPSTLGAVRAAASHVVATAASNNIKFQTDLMEAYPDIFVLLIQVAAHHNSSVGTKGLHALGNMVRNLAAARTAFVNAGAPELLQGVLLSGELYSNSMKRRALTIVTDLLELDPSTLCMQQGKDHTKHILPNLASAAVDLLQVDDHDIQEKALHVLRGVLKLHDLEAEHALNRLLMEKAGQKIGKYLDLLDSLIAEEAGNDVGDPRHLEALKALGTDAAYLLSLKSATDELKMPAGYNNTKYEL